MIKAILLLSFLISFSICQADNSKNEFDFKIDSTNISLSGISSGGYMATQFHVAHSAKISAVAIIAGGPFWCAQGDILKALGICMKGGQMDFDKINNYLKDSEKEKLIDSSSNMKKDKLWIFHGSKDIVMALSVSKAIKEFYSQFIDHENINIVSEVPVNHGLPTLSKGIACDAVASPFINSCNYDAAGEILKAFHRPLKDRSTPSGRVAKVDQSDYKLAGFTDTGYVYVPSGCNADNTCQLHIAFHGCKQSSEVIGEEFVKSAGYNEWAESNDIVVFYPQIQSSLVNPNGCWDWWGYTGENYANKLGPQIIAINSMIDKLAGVSK